MTHTHTQSTTLILATTALLLSTSAFGQYIWLNDRGVKQFSDQPPPKSVPKSKILKSPYVKGQTISQTEGDAASATSETKPKSEIEKLEKPMTVASKNEDFNKRKLEREEREKKTKEEQTAKDEKNKNCNDARGYERSLEGGIVISRTNQNGERTLLDDNQRAQELVNIKKTLASCR